MTETTQEERAQVQRGWLVSQNVMTRMAIDADRLAQYERDLEHDGQDRSQDTEWLRRGFLQRGAEIERLRAERERLRELPKSLRDQADHAHKYRSYPYYSGQMAAFREAAHQIERAYDTPEIKPENCEECGGLGHSSEAAGMHCPHCNGTGNAPHTPEQTEDALVRDLNNIVDPKEQESPEYERIRRHLNAS